MKKTCWLFMILILLSGVCVSAEEETICLEGIDPNVLETDWVNLENSSVTILVPEDTTDEQMQLLAQKFQGSAIITDASQVKRGTGQRPENPMPDIAEILSAYGLS